jgi:4-hydroxy-3-methylbut-2-enyl diphosphate reductase
MSRSELTILLASPRGFCAGVERAIEIVEQALEQNGPPVYVRHEIVHNRHVVDALRAKGAVFVEELDEVPEDALVVFSAHGVPKAVPAEARRRRLLYADATCPLVSKVHRGVEQHHRSGRTVLLIGHSGHPEVVGTMGQLPPGAVILVENVAQAERLSVPDPDKLAYATQTTLSVRETGSVLAVLKRRFPTIAGPRREDICYATTNRQRAVEAIAPRADLTLIIGAANFQFGASGRGGQGGGLPGGDPRAERGKHALAAARGREDGRDQRRRLGARISGRGADRRLPRAFRGRCAGGSGRPGGRLVQDPADSHATRFVILPGHRRPAAGRPAGGARARLMR